MKSTPRNTKLNSNIAIIQNEGLINEVLEFEVADIRICKTLPYDVLIASKESLKEMFSMSESIFY